MLKEFFYDLMKEYGNIGLFFSLCLEYLGFPVPGETMMSFYGYLIHSSFYLKLALSVVLATAGTFTGSAIAFLLSYRYGENLVLKFGKYFFINREKLNKVEALLDKYKVSLLLFSPFIPGVRHIMPYFCGISKIQRRRYFTLNLMGSVIWCTTFLSLGYLVGDKWHRFVNIKNVNLMLILFLLVFVLLVMKFFKKHRGTILAITFPLLAFVKLSEILIREQFSVFDNTIYDFLKRFFTSNVRIVMQLISGVGSMAFLIGVTLMLLAIHKRHPDYGRYWFYLAVNLAASAAITEFFKDLFHRERPDILRMVEVTGYSFPSGHSMIGMSFYGLLMYFLVINLKSRLKKALSAVFLSLLILFIGISRIYLGVHYASDVLAGFAAGLSWLVIYITLLNRVEIFGLKPRNESP